MKINVTVKLNRGGSYDMVIGEGGLTDGLARLLKGKKLTQADIRGLEYSGHEISYSEYARDALAGRL